MLLMATLSIVLILYAVGVIAIFIYSWSKGGKSVKWQLIGITVLAALLIGSVVVKNYITHTKLEVAIDELPIWPGGEDSVRERIFVDGSSGSYAVVEYIFPADEDPHELNTRYTELLVEDGWDLVECEEDTCDVVKGESRVTVSGRFEKGTQYFLGSDDSEYFEEVSLTILVKLK